MVGRVGSFGIWISFLNVQIFSSCSLGRLVSQLNLAPRSGQRLQAKLCSQADFGQDEQYTLKMHFDNLYTSPKWFLPGTKVCHPPNLFSLKIKNKQFQFKLVHWLLLFKNFKKILREGKEHFRERKTQWQSTWQINKDNNQNLEVGEHRWLSRNSQGRLRKKKLREEGEWKKKGKKWNYSAETQIRPIQDMIEWGKT